MNSALVDSAAVLAPERHDAHRRRVLMICFAYPPVGGAGMIRPAKFVKYLSEFGYTPAVLTPSTGTARLRCDADFGDSPDATIHRTPYRDIVRDVRTVLRMPPSAPVSPSAPGPQTPARAGWRRTMTRLAYAAITVPDEHVGWKRPALDAARALLARERFDLVYSTSPPETAHLIARTVKQEYGIPWVADLRDLWSGDHYRQRGRAKRWLLRRIERRTLNDADLLVTVSEPWRRQLAASYGTRGRRVECIPHGFDADDYPVVVTPPDVFTITYTGTLDRHFQNPEPFFAALGDLVRRGDIARDRIRVNFHVFGDNLPDFDALATAHGLHGIVRRCPPLEYRACLTAQQASTALLALQWRSEAGEGNPPLKVYDYLGARRPILVVGSGERVLGPLLTDTGAGVTAGDGPAIAQVLADWYREFRDSGQVQWRGREARLGAYTRRAQTARLAALFDSVVDRAAGA
jgi:glycosyltransferase involved in cell wall biosynthesis